MWQERRNSSRATRIALLVARGRLPRQHGGGNASLARELVEELVAVHKSTALGRLNAPGELGLLLGSQFECLVIFMSQDGNGRALLQALALHLDLAADDLARD